MLIIDILVKRDVWDIIIDVVIILYEVCRLIFKFHAVAFAIKRVFLWSRITIFTQHD